MQSLDDVSFKVIYHDASIARGSSGGALVDIDGNLIGVNTWGLQNSDEFSFAIPNYIVYTFLINSGVLE
jgi:S1-C subfamily serine protease